MRIVNLVNNKANSFSTNSELFEKLLANSSKNLVSLFVCSQKPSLTIKYGLYSNLNCDI